ncbi:hypothetical protein [Pseudomonas putida]|uniref:hypothetical protein n=1 Tax=Pseudomonas putida TaxID=303 RepID=UPI0018AC0D80|nr:hypothetical protein [Pseudomonas putida]MBF8660824.1 hypothetical protein [Pseudomonas putida]
MNQEWLEFAGVKYFLSATSQGEGPWKGEANVRVRRGAGGATQQIPTPTYHATSQEAMIAAQELLKALCLSGALKAAMPSAYPGPE